MAKRQSSWWFGLRINRLTRLPFNGCQVVMDHFHFFERFRKTINPPAILILIGLLFLRLLPQNKMPYIDRKLYTKTCPLIHIHSMLLWIMDSGDWVVGFESIEYNSLGVAYVCRSRQMRWFQRIQKKLYVYLFLDDFLGVSFIDSHYHPSIGLLFSCGINSKCSDNSPSRLTTYLSIPCIQ